MILVLLEGHSESHEYERFCVSLIEAGADAICLANASVLSGSGLISVCRANDALVFGASADAFPMGAGDFDGLVAADVSGAPGVLAAGADVLAGVQTSRDDDAALAAELGLDFIVHRGDPAEGAVFRGIQALTPSPVFAGPVASKDDAVRLVEAGVFRLWGHVCFENDDVVERVANWSRALGRCL